MPAIALARHLPRTAVAAVLAGVLVLAEGLSALADGGTPLPGRLREPQAVPASSGPVIEMPEPVSFAPTAAFPSVPAERMRPLSAAAQAVAAQADPPPFAPGGDDILGGAVSDPVRPVPLRDEMAATTPRPVVGGLAPGAVPALPRGEGRPGVAPAGPRLWLDRVLTAEGTRMRLNVAHAGDGTCRLAGALQGSLPADGRQVLPSLPPGRHRVGVNCRLGGAQADELLTIAVPLPVLAGSEANRRAYAEADAARAGLRQLGLAAGGGRPAPPVAAGDFFQEGRLALFAAGAGGVQVHGVDDRGRWSDRTAELLPWPEDRRGCAAPGQALSADLNRDGLPDVLLTCGEAPPLLFLSQPDGHYRRIDTGLPPPAGPVELLDGDGDALIDLVRPVPPAASPPLLWRGRGDGRFVTP